MAQRPTDTDRKNAGVPAVRSLLAKGIAAEIANAPRDVEAGRMRYDTKAVHTHMGHVVLARRNARRYDPTKVDRVVLVQLDAQTGCSIDLAHRTAELHSIAHIEQAWDVDVAALNEMMPQHTDSDRTWREIYIPVEELADYRVLLTA